MRKLRAVTSSTLVVMMTALMVAGALRPTEVRAAAGEGTATIAVGTGTLTNANTATYGSDLSTVPVTVGTLAYLRVKLTVGASHIAAAQNNVTVQIPTNLFPTNGFDTNEEAAITDVNAVGEYFISYTDTDSGTTNNAAISFAASASVNTGLITIQADQQMDATDIVILTVAVNDLNYLRAAQNVTISVDDTGGNSLVAIAVLPTVSTAAADAGASIVVASPTVGASGNTTITMTVPFALDAADAFRVTFPAYINISGVTADQVATGTFDDAGGTITCNDSAQILTCVTSGATATTGTVILANITSYYIGTTDVTMFEVEDEANTSNDIATDSAVALTDVTAADAAASVALGTNNYVGVAGSTTATLTLPFALDADDTIDITFPAHINVASVAAAVTGTLEASDSITCAAASQVVTCTTSAATNASGTIIMTGIKSSYVATTDITSVEVENEGNASNDIATDSVVALSDTLPSDEEEDEEAGSSEDTYDIDVTVPAASANYMPGDTVDITWNTAGGSAAPGFVSLYYSVDGGVTLETIALNTVNDSSFSWTVPDITAESVTITANGTDLVTVLATDESGAFSIGANEGETDDTDTTDDSTDLLPEGSYMKGESWSTVYYIHDGMRHPFLDSQTYFTYADDFSDVVTVDDDELGNYTIGTPMLPKAGTVLVKIQSVNNVYALEADNTLRWITSEDLAVEMYGSDWADYVIDVPVTAWGHFTVGSDIDEASDVDVMLSDMSTRDELNSK